MRLGSLLSRIFSRVKPSNLLCALCSKPLAIEHAKTDADGKAVHEECYFQQLRLKRIKDGYG